MLLGGAQTYKDFLAAYAGSTKTAVDATTAATAALPAGLAAKLQAALTAGSGDVAEAIDMVRANAGADAATVAY